jgi:DNA ligase (NAD+)
MEHFVGRRAMNIDSLGAETLDQLYQAGLINNIADLYDLKKEQLLVLDRMAEKSAQNLIAVFLTVARFRLNGCCMRLVFAM